MDVLGNFFWWDIGEINETFSKTLCNINLKRVKVKIGRVKLKIERVNLEKEILSLSDFSNIFFLFKITNSRSVLRFYGYKFVHIYNVMLFRKARWIVWVFFAMMIIGTDEKEKRVYLLIECIHTECIDSIIARRCLRWIPNTFFWCARFWTNLYQAKHNIAHQKTSFVSAEFWILTISLRRWKNTKTWKYQS